MVIFLGDGKVGEMLEKRVVGDAQYQQLAASFVTVGDAKMYYLDVGAGDPILFLHGIPTSSYLWRKIIPQLSSDWRCVAPDFIDMGQSEKRYIGYQPEAQARYLSQFIEEMALSNIVIVMHGWGSMIGFDYAMRHPENVKALIFSESYLHPSSGFQDLSLPLQQLNALLSTPDHAYDLIVEQNFLIEQWLPMSSMLPLSEEDMNYYRQAFTSKESRKLLWQYWQSFPLLNRDPDTTAWIERYSHALTESHIPKLMFYGIPGFNTTIATVKWAKNNLPHLSLVSVEDSLHLVPESCPQLFAESIKHWLKELPLS